MSKPLIFLFLFQLIISIDPPKDKKEPIKAEENEIEKKSEKEKKIYESMIQLFANYAINYKIKNDFEDEYVTLNKNIKTIPEGYNNCKITPKDYIKTINFNLKED